MSGESRKTKEGKSKEKTSYGVKSAKKKVRENKNEWVVGVRRRKTDHDSLKTRRQTQVGKKTARKAIESKRSARSQIVTRLELLSREQTKLIGLGGQSLPRLSGDFLPNDIPRCLRSETHPIVMGLHSDGMGSC